MGNPVEKNPAESCVEATIIRDERHDSVKCAIINGLMGRDAGMHIDGCAFCRHADGDDSFCVRMAKSLLRTCISSGRFPSLENSKDLATLSQNYAALATREECESLLALATAKITATQTIGEAEGLQQLREIDEGLGTNALETML